MLLIQALRRGGFREQVFEVTCRNGHLVKQSASELSEYDFDTDYWECPNCAVQGGASFEPPELIAECSFCGEQFEVEADAYLLSEHQCYGGISVANWDVPGTHWYFRNLITDTIEFSAARVQRRPDYWNAVTHFTSPDNFISILRSGRIRASPTGFFGSQRRSAELKALSKAVCLTETPLEHVAEIQDRFGEFGFCFEKKALKGRGAGPTINLSPRLLKDQRKLANNTTENIHGGWAKRLLPFINKVDRDFDYLHEREWRVPRDIILETTNPWLVMPQAFDKILYEMRVTPKELATWMFNHDRALFDSRGFPIADIGSP